MEINTSFETYIIVDEEEVKVEVQSSGDIIEDGFSHEFGFTSTPYIDNVYITSIYDTENDRDINFKDLSKIQKRILLNLAQDELNEREAQETYEE